MSNNNVLYNTSKTNPSSYKLNPLISTYTLARTYYGTNMSLNSTTTTNARNFFNYTGVYNVTGNIYIPSSPGCIRFINVFGLESKEYGWITITTMYNEYNSYPSYAYKSSNSQVYTCVKGAQGYWGAQTLCGCAMTSRDCYIHASNVSALRVTVTTLSII